MEEGRRGCFYHSYRGPILEPRAFSPLRDLFRRGREREGRDRIVRGRERRRKKFGGEPEEKELTLGEGDEGGLDGIRGMSCNNRAAIRASVPTRGGATARLGSARLGSARLASAVPFLWVVAFPSTRVQFAQPYDQWTINFLSLVRTLFLKNCDFHRSSSYLYFKSFKFFN